MNLGLGNLVELKAQLLPAALQPGTNYDAKIVPLGRGVALQFESYCARKFGYTEDSQVFSADRDRFMLDRFPVTSISGIEWRAMLIDGWQAQDESVILNLDERIGEVILVGALGDWTGRVRLTYIGGFWFDESEDGSGEQPNGAATVPADLKLAWYLQCRKVWESIDKQGTNVVKVGSGAQFVTESLGGLDLVPEVKLTLNNYRRMAMT